MPQGSAITVLLVDDHPVVRAGYRRLLEDISDVQIVAEAKDGQTACTAYGHYRPRVMVLDLDLPDLGGLEVIRRVRAKDPEARILVISVHDSPVVIQRALQTGAAGYLTKHGGSAVMVEALRAVSQGITYIDPALVQTMAGSPSSGNDPLGALSEREFQVFQLLAEGRSVVEIANILSISPKTAGVHHTNIMKKLGLHNVAQLTRLALRAGVITP